MACTTSAAVREAVLHVDWEVVAFAEIADPVGELNVVQHVFAPCGEGDAVIEGRAPLYESVVPLALDLVGDFGELGLCWSSAVGPCAWWSLLVVLTTVERPRAAQGRPRGGEALPVQGSVRPTAGRSRSFPALSR